MTRFSSTSLRTLASLSVVTLALAATPACELLSLLGPPAPTPEEELGLECGTAPESFDGTGDVIHAGGAEGCVRIERQASEADPTIFEPRRLVLHVDGFTRRYDIDTTELTYESSMDGMNDVVTTTTEDEVVVRIQFDICTGAWNLDVDEGEVYLPVVGT